MRAMTMKQATVSALPTYTLGVDPLPVRCSSCGSTLLSVDEPSGSVVRGAMTCTICGASICWLRPRLTTRAPVAAPAPAPTPTVRTAPTWKRPSCTERCRRVRVLPLDEIIADRRGPCWLEHHDIDGHDGARSALLALSVTLIAVTAPSPRLIRTGPIAIDTVARRVAIDDVDVDLAPIEWDILVYLGRRLGEWCPRDEIAASIWAGDLNRRSAVPKLLIDDRGHRLRISTARLRLRLGAAATYVETRPRVGYRLRAATPHREGELLPAEPTTPIVHLSKGWSLAHDRCIRCSTTSRPHRARGYCEVCYRAIHYYPILKEARRLAREARA